MTSAAEPHPHPIDPARLQRARDHLPSLEDVARTSSILSLLGDPTRARVLYALDIVDELCVGDLALALDSSEDAIGYALRILRTAGLVMNRKQGRVVYYRLASGFPEPLLDHCLRRLVDLSADTDPDD
ncbi:ArsR/SmtB family transcription factor [Nakamurella endophytica]|uniref:Transcriptional regulator n=1 Tax=Nakamurella endophytica TaxID=1748367 RepID=A0A917WK97_9ACTN|nr:metalloregulator ArsR/SmtB family transcription factor [Nakamurella endophytica]GGM09728.1 transcriptional regulator [Nakamurella endophytica]